MRLVTEETGCKDVWSSLHGQPVHETGGREATFLCLGSLNGDRSLLLSDGFTKLDALAKSCLRVLRLSGCSIKLVLMASLSSRSD